MPYTKILTIEEVRKAIYQDDDFDTDELERLADTASSFIYQKTGYDFGSDETVEPLAKHCAELYIRQQYFNGQGYNPEYDYTFGIAGLLIDLQNIARDKDD